VAQKYGIPLADLPTHCVDAVEAAERARARTLIVRGGQAVAAIVPMTDVDKVDPPDPTSDGADPLLALCGACHHDAFVDSLVMDIARTGLWHRGTPTDAGLGEVEPRTLPDGRG
jgi:hypothetical protein